VLSIVFSSLVSSVDAELARILAQHRHQLYLDGCRSLDAVTASALAKHGLETIRRSWEDSLRAFKAMEEGPSPGELACEPEHELDLLGEFLCGPGHLEQLTLSLSGLRQLSPAAARGLGKHRGRILLQGVTRLSCESAGILLSRLEVNLSPCLW
jgi:hypothetical protein